MLKRVRTGVMELLFEKRKLSFGEFKAAPQLITSQWKQRQGWYLNQPTNYSLGYDLWLICPKVTTRRARRTSLTTFCVSDPILQICVAPLGWQTQAAFVGEWASVYEEIHPGVSLLTCLAFAFHLSIYDAHTGQEKSKTSTGKNDSFPPGQHLERFPAAFSQIKPKSPVGPMPPPKLGNVSSLFKINQGIHLQLISFDCSKYSNQSSNTMNISFWRWLHKYCIWILWSGASH